MPLPPAAPEEEQGGGERSEAQRRYAYLPAGRPASLLTAGCAKEVRCPESRARAAAATAAAAGRRRLRPRSSRGRRTAARPGWPGSSTRSR
eukprot:COSAG02_NODE_1340_length_13187_cov_6.960804_15_plen_91_part_00